MSSTSTYTMRNGPDSSSSSSTPTSAAGKGDPQHAHLHHIDNTNRFLADQYQRPPVGLGPAQTEDEAKAAGEARASANIRAFDMQFGCGSKSLGIKSAQE